MRDLKLEPVGQRRLAVAAALLLAVGVVAGLTASANPPVPFEAGSGPWVNAAVTYDCEGDKVCAEWPNEANTSAMVCCIDQEDVGTYDFTDNCDYYVTQRALN